MTDKKEAFLDWHEIPEKVCSELKSANIEKSTSGKTTENNTKTQQTPKTTKKSTNKYKTKSKAKPKKEKKEETSKKSFRLSALNLFLEYPANGPDGQYLTREIILVHLLDYFESKVVQKIIVAKEKGEENDYDHFHAYISLKDRCNIRSASALDILGIHGNYQTAKHIRAAIKYTTKEDKEYLSRGFHPIYETIHEYDSPLEAFCAIALTNPQINPREMLSAKASRIFPKDLIKILVDYTRNPLPYKRFLSSHFPESKKPLNDVLIRMDIAADVSRWALQQRPEKGEFTRTLYFYGDTRLGKSGLVRIFLESMVGPKSLLVIRNLDQARSFSEDVHKAVLFDDVSLKKLTPEDKIAILSSEDEKVFNIKYSICEIPRTTITVFIGNEDPRISLVRGVPALSQQEAILKRIFPIKISTECRYGDTDDGTPPIIWDYPTGLNEEKSPLKYNGSIYYLSRHFNQLFRECGNVLEDFLLMGSEPEETDEEYLDTSLA
eukprot:TRINITY_DN4825_c0_g1_i2.p1 TRINITY_DN4825_c0_g1~~TRINITY_DN4825_c0_g1_i2.p1  ORF type:complete len:493 (-),score=-86.45 TRINITY_DN4825_c0_g1_i2:3453-4931(-)